MRFFNLYGSAEPEQPVKKESVKSERSEEHAKNESTGKTMVTVEAEYLESLVSKVNHLKLEISAQQEIIKDLVEKNTARSSGDVPAPEPVHPCYANDEEFAAKYHHLGVEGSPPLKTPRPAPKQFRRFYNVYKGTKVGIFTEWNRVHTATNRVPGANQVHYDDYDSARAAFDGQLKEIDGVKVLRMTV